MPQNKQPYVHLQILTSSLESHIYLEEHSLQAISSKIIVCIMLKDEKNLLNEKESHVANKNAKEIRLRICRHLTAKVPGEMSFEFSLLSHYTQ